MELPDSSLQRPSLNTGPELPTSSLLDPKVNYVHDIKTASIKSADPDEVLSAHSHKSSFFDDFDHTEDECGFHHHADCDDKKCREHRHEYHNHYRMTMTKTPLASCFGLITATMGAGVLTLPKVSSYFGLVTMVVIIIIFALLTCDSFFI